jgi:simple sugar transport system ATP-binding protein
MGMGVALPLSLEETRMDSKLIELHGIAKSFGNVLALRDVSLHVNGGDNGSAEVVGLLGDNGAGKSTLIKIISGVHDVDSGEIVVQGQKRDNWSVSAAQEAGIETVYQDRALCPQQTITRNIFMGRNITRFLGLIDSKQERAEAEQLMRGIGFTSKVFSPDSVVGQLSGGERQGVAIARALHFRANLLILDEPTTALSLTESEKVFGFVRASKERNCSVIFISHNIYHAYDVSDRFIILDRGRVVMEADKSEVASAEVLVKEMQSIARDGHKESSP